MKRIKNRNFFADIAAILFILEGAILLIRYYKFGFPYTAVLGIIYISLGAILFIRKKDIFLLVPVGVAVLLEVFHCIQNCHIRTISGAIAWILFFMALFINVALNKQNISRISKVICILPSVFLALGNIIPWLQYENFIHVIMSRGAESLFIAVLMLLIGIWLIVPETIFCTDNIIGGADKLKEYKELLDLDAITQEEFEAKKKQILGLGVNDTVPTNK